MASPPENPPAAPPAAPQAPRSRKVLFGVTTGLFWFSLYVYVALLGPHVEAAGASHAQVGAVVGSYGLAQMLLRIPLGLLSDHLRHRRAFITLGFALSAGSALLFLLGGSVSVLFAARTLAGCAAATWVHFTVLFASYHRPEDFTRAMGILNAANLAGQTTALMLGGLVSGVAGMGPVFLIALGAGLLGVLLSRLLVERRDPDGPGLDPTHLPALLRSRILLAATGMAVFQQLLSFSTQFGFVPVFARDRLAATDAQLGTLASVTSLATALGSLAIGTLLLPRIRGREMAANVTTLLVSSLCVALIPLGGSWALLLVLQVLGGFARGMTFTLSMGLAVGTASPSLRATAMGIYQSLYGLGMLFGPVLSGALSDRWGLSVAFPVVALVAAAGGLLMGWLSRALRKADPSAPRGGARPG